MYNWGSRRFLFAACKPQGAFKMTWQPGCIFKIAIYGSTSYDGWTHLKPHHCMELIFEKKN